MKFSTTGSMRRTLTEAPVLRVFHGLRFLPRLRPALLDRRGVSRNRHRPNGTAVPGVHAKSRQQPERAAIDLETPRGCLISGRAPAVSHRQARRSRRAPLTAYVAISGALR